MNARTLMVPVSACLLALAAAPLAAQEAEGEAMSSGASAAMEAYREAGTPGETHRVLARSAGTWSAEVRMWMEPGAEPTVTRTTSVIEPVMGGRFLRETVEGEVFGQPFRGVSLIGFNNVSGKVQGVWYDNHSTALYLYEGSVAEDGTMELRSGHHDPVTGDWIESKSVRRMEGDDRMIDTAWERRDGEMVKTMEIVYRRR